MPVPKTKNKNRFGLVTDSSNTISRELAKKLGISVLNLSITRTKGVEIEVFEDITTEKNLNDIFTNMANGYKYATSTIPLGIIEEEIIRLFEIFEYVIFLPVSKGLSNQYFQLEALVSVYPNLIILNSESSAYINEYMIIQVQELIKKSDNVETLVLIKSIKNLINDIKLRSVSFFAIQDISGSTGGRIPKSVVKLWNWAKLSPIVELDYKNKKAAFLRNWDQISEKIIELVSARFNGLEGENIVDISIVHALAEQKYIDHLLTALINAYKIEPNKIKIRLFSCTTSIHVMKNAIGIVVINNKYKNNI